MTEAVQANFSVDVALSGEQGLKYEGNQLLADVSGFLADLSRTCGVDGPCMSMCLA